MIPAAFECHAPGSMGDRHAVARPRLGEDAKVLSGGQSMIPLMKLHLAAPRRVVDIDGMSGLRTSRRSDGVLRISALTRERTSRIPTCCSSRPLSAALRHEQVIGDPLVRNLATVGGNLAHGDPANDHPATMLALGAEVVATGPTGERRIPIATFFTGLFATALEADEILTEIRIPSPARAAAALCQTRAKVGDFATAGVAVQVDAGRGRHLHVSGIGLTNVGSTPIEATGCEAALQGSGRTRRDQASGATGRSGRGAASDLRGSVEYKRDLVRVLTRPRARKASSTQAARR